MAEEALDLGAFVEAAGAGLADAQGSIAGAELATTAMAVSEARLEARVALDVGPTGAVRVQTLDRHRLQSLGSGAGALSTVTVDFVALTAAPERATQPAVGRDRAIEIVAKRPDVTRLAEVLGPLRFDAVLVPDRPAWLVTATDDDGRLVRQAVITEEG